MTNNKDKSKFAILHADDEEIFRIQIQELLSAEGYKIDTVCDGVEAINSIQKNKYDLVLLDISMPKVNGIEVLHFVKEKYPPLEVIMLTGFDNVKVAVNCLKNGASHYITKPFLTDDLLQTISRALEHRVIINENKILRSELSRIIGDSDLIGNSAVFKNTLSIAAKVAPSDTSVVIQGETGTGKEMIAKFIHKNSPRVNRHFVAINCAAIPDTLLESELFGHERGAFTDARSMKQGLIELADEGTLFLDEVGDISTIVQPKLLRFVQTGEFRRIGGNIELKANVRIISATNKDLRVEVDQGRFREDLLFRLNVISILIPPLRERREDIPLLVENFFKNKMRARIKKTIHPEVSALLLDYEWPGNIRELENVLESSIILSSGDIIQPSDIMIPHKKLIQSRSSSELTNQIGTNVTIKEIERLHISSVLKNEKGDKNKAAKILGISLKTLYTKIAQYKN